MISRVYRKTLENKYTQHSEKLANKIQRSLQQKYPRGTVNNLQYFFFIIKFLTRHATVKINKRRINKSNQRKSIQACRQSNAKVALQMLVSTIIYTPKAIAFECWHPYYVTTRRGASRYFDNFFPYINDIFFDKERHNHWEFWDSSHMLSLHGANGVSFARSSLDNST